VQVDKPAEFEYEPGIQTLHEVAPDAMAVVKLPAPQIWQADKPVALLYEPELQAKQAV
jgi:hypothetical protein